MFLLGNYLQYQAFGAWSPMVSLTYASYKSNFVLNLACFKTVFWSKFSVQVMDWAISHFSSKLFHFFPLQSRSRHENSEGSHSLDGICFFYRQAKTTQNKKKSKTWIIFAIQHIHSGKHFWLFFVVMK